MPFQNTKSGKLYYEERGLGGPSIFLIHGGFCDHSDWYYQIQALAPTHRTIAVDLPGHGRSVVRGAELYTIESFAKDIVLLIQTLEAGPAVLVGHSFGCRVILEVNLQASEEVAAIILVDGSRVETSGRDQPGHSLAQWIDREGTKPTLQQLFEGMFIDEADDKFRETVLARLAAFPDNVARSLQSSSMAWDALKAEKALESVKVPTLVIQSTNLLPGGRRTSFSARVNHSSWLDLVGLSIPGRQEKIIRGAGHFCMVEAPTEVNGAISNFLRRAPSDSSRAH
jgi:pimeloyl-ACP methyl ester carboxylesterase